MAELSVRAIEQELNALKQQRAEVPMHSFSRNARLMHAHVLRSKPATIVFMTQNREVCMVME